MPDDLSAAQAAATEAIDIPDPVPEPEVLDTDLPEDTDTFDRPYVEKLRNEAAAKRTELRQFKDAFDGYTPDETTRYLELAHMLNENPEQAMEEFQAVTDRLAKQLGKEAPVADESIPAAEAAPEETTPSAGLSADDITRLVGEQMEAERATAAQAQSNRDVFAEAASISESYAEGSPALVQLLTVAQHDAEAGGTLQGAHMVLMGQLETIQNQAVEDYREGLRSGAAHPPVVSGQPATLGNAEPPKTIAEASARAKERFAAAYGD